MSEELTEKPKAKVVTLSPREQQLLQVAVSEALRAGEQRLAQLETRLTARENAFVQIGTIQVSAPILADAAGMAVHLANQYIKQIQPPEGHGYE